MRQLSFLRSVTLRALWLSLLVTGCGSSTDVNSTVQVLDTRFSPYTLTVSTGTNVVWVWNTIEAHLVVIGAYDSPIRSEGQTTGSFEHRFGAPGTYSYLCAIHPGMTGTIIVQ
jgi:plastocyanin